MRRNCTACPPQLYCTHHHAQVLFQDGKFQWKRLENLIELAREGGGGGASSSSPSGSSAIAGSGSSSSRGGLDLSDTAKDALRVVLLDDKLRTQVGSGGGGCGVGPGEARRMMLLGRAGQNTRAREAKVRVGGGSGVQHARRQVSR